MKTELITLAKILQTCSAQTLKRQRHARWENDLKKLGILKFTPTIMLTLASTRKTKLALHC